MKMLKNIILASLALMPLALVESSAFASDIAEDTVKVGYALGNVAEDALDTARALERLDGVAGSNAGFYLRELINDTELLVSYANQLALLLDADHSDQGTVAAKFAEVTLHWNRVRGSSDKAVQQLYAQSLGAEAYRLKSAVIKIRTRYVYLQNELGGR